MGVRSKQKKNGNYAYQQRCNLSKKRRKQFDKALMQHNISEAISLATTIEEKCDVAEHIVKFKIKAYYKYAVQIFQMFEKNSAVRYKCKYYLGILKIEEYNYKMAEKYFLEAAMFSYDYRAASLIELARIETMRGNIEQAIKYYGYILSETKKLDFDENSSIIRVAKLELGWLTNISKEQKMLDEIYILMSNLNDKEAIAKIIYTLELIVYDQDDAKYSPRTKLTAGKMLILVNDMLGLHDENERVISYLFEDDLVDESFMTKMKKENVHSKKISVGLLGT